jgi:hypothetical protein
VNKLVTIWFLFVGLLAVNAQYDIKTAERDRMAEAKVKTQIEYTHDYKNGTPSSQGYKSSVRKFNANGDITEETNYNASDKIISVIVYQYNNKNERVNHERYQGNREKLQYSQKMVYDSKGNKIKEYGFDGVASYSNTYTYENGKLVEMTYTLDNVVVEKRKLSYSGNKTEILIFDANNELIFKQVNAYTPQGLLVSEVKTDFQGNVVYMLDLEYRDDGVLLSEARKRGDLLEYKKIYEYDTENRIIKEETINLEGERYVSHEYKYNDRSYLELEKWKKNNRSNGISSKKMTYDSKGIHSEVESYFASYKLHSLYKYTYEYY